MLSRTEVEMLSRTHYPSVPQLLDRGWWHSEAGTVHPHLALELIRGLPLYEWGLEHQATSRQVLKVVAQVAWALEVVHRGEGLHRDVRLPAQALHRRVVPELSALIERMLAEEPEARGRRVR